MPGAMLTLVDLANRTGAPMARKHKFIKKATANAHGQFRAKAEAAGESTREFAKEHEHDSGKTGKQARLALTLMSMHGNRAAKRYAKSKKG